MPPVQPRTSEAPAAVSTQTAMNSDGSRLVEADNVTEDVFVLLGNGPSLAHVDLQGLEPQHTFGLNAAYRAYRRIGFWPTYFGCFDALVCGHHAADFKDLVIDSPIRRFFFINFDEKRQPTFPEPEIRASEKFTNINFVMRNAEERARDDIIATSFDPFVDMGTSGTNAVQCALLMGYRKIVLLGCDANYVEVVEGAEQEAENRRRIVMRETPAANPNYWFSDYQQQGDRFNVPDTQRTQIPAWNRLAATIARLGIDAEIVNCTPGSKIEVFRKMPLDQALDYFGKTRAARLDWRNSVLGVPEPPRPSAAPAAPRPVAPTVKPAPSRGLVSKFAKLRRDPHAFFADSRLPPLRLLRLFFRAKTATSERR